jgi:hypothetical protein
MEQYANSKSVRSDPDPVLAVVAGERIRVAYQLSRLVQTDLENPRIRYQRGQLVSLSDATHELGEELHKVIERL